MFYCYPKVDLQVILAVLFAGWVPFRPLSQQMESV